MWYIVCTDRHTFGYRQGALVEIGTVSLQVSYTKQMYIYTYISNRGKTSPCTDRFLLLFSIIILFFLTVA